MSAKQIRDLDQETRRGVITFLIREPIGVLFVAATLFIPARTLAWPMGWALVAIYALWVTVTILLVLPKSPGLLAERVARKKDAKTWDTALMGVVGLLTLAKQIIAGLDFYYGWTREIWEVPLALQIAALVIAALAYTISPWAMRVNAYFSKIVRIQEDRGHTVVTGGPYRIVRHPTYLGTILFETVSPIMLGSLWALIPGVLSALLFIVRTALEDRTLREELPGYQAYAERVRYRLLPGVW